MRYLISFLLFFSYSASFGCFNEYYALDAQGHFHQVDVGMIRFQLNFDQKKTEQKLIQLGKKLHTKADFKLLSDYGLNLLKGGKINEARIIFEALANAYPNEYSIIANLGTTYELLGENEKALEYIRKGLKLNPNSHGGSEWIHVRILQTKIRLSKDANYLKEHEVLGLTAQQKASASIREQLYIQLKERFPFCKGPDPIMADLFIDLGDCYSETISFEHAKGLYQIAKTYYHTDGQDVDEKIDHIGKLRAKYAHRSPSEHYTQEQQEMGMVAKIDGVPYKSYLQDLNPDNYQVDWLNIEANPDTLLAFVGLKKLEETQEEQKENNEQSKSPGKKQPTLKPGKKQDKSMFLPGLILLTLIIAIFTYFSMKKKK